ncbi:hypothetical protein LO763_22110 [Glycomyces sp. A-F 0318]|uniref:hypothetical protein n=1 Tax=Glycomyces amatae TaxID=2881355 RepID=UPI001E6230C2|nr:hypothetical protein [Glycomyces amatae]MCD0446312.1 hypothetical protein [Glycomyces amatae]
MMIGTATVTALASVARTPWEQMPLHVVTVWLGPVLPWLLQWVWSRPRRLRRRPSVVNTVPAIPHVAATWTVRQTPKDLVVPAVGTLLCLLLCVDLWAPPFTPITDVVQRTIGVMWSSGSAPLPPPLSGPRMLGVSTAASALLQLGYEIWKYARRSHDAALRVDETGFTLSAAGATVSLPWGAVAAFTIVRDCLVIDSLALRGTAFKAVNDAAAYTTGYLVGVELHAPQRPRLLLCPFAAVSNVQPLLDQIERYWGQSLPRPVIPAQRSSGAELGSTVADPETAGGERV